MGRSRYKFYEEHYPYFITSTLLEGIPLFPKPHIAQILLDQLAFIQKQRAVTLYAFVIMENHFHAIVQGQELSKKIAFGKVIYGPTDFRGISPRWTFTLAQKIEMEQAVSQNWPHVSGLGGRVTSKTA